MVAVGICVLPALYAWFNIAANWDPYGNTGEIVVAVANNDKGCAVDGVQYEIGSKIVENLKGNRQIGWTFMSREKAVEGVKSGKYYAAIVIPENFSEAMSSILGDKLESPKLEYYINEKKNAIAPKITDKGATTIQQQVNTEFISVATETVANVLNVTSAQLEGSGVTIVDKLIANLRAVSSDLSQYEAAIKAFQDVTDSVVQLTKTAQLTIPDVSAVLSQGNQLTANSAGVLESSRNTAGTIGSTMGNVMSTTVSTFDNVSSLTNSALQNLETDAAFAANQLGSAGWICDEVIGKNDEVYGKLETLRGELLTILPDDAESVRLIDGMMTKVAEATEHQNNLKDSINQAVSQINSSTAVAEDTRKQISAGIDQSKADISGVRASFETEVQPNMNTLLDNIATTTANVSGLLTATQGSLGNLDEIFNGVNGALASGKSALENTRSVITQTQDRLNNIISQVQSVGQDEQLNKLIELLKNDPQLTGEFMSSPVKLDTTQFYEIENYGSAMAPFYSILAIWVGAIVLVAILKVEVDEDDEIRKVRPTVSYLGRSLTFLTFGLVQATIIALGDLFYLKIQCTNMGLFLVGAWISSFVFVNIVYALTVSFGDIGKAVSVIILVLQIGGSGGTFPIEVTPPFFRAIYPWLPFTYAINALRECVGGVYKNAFWLDVGRLLLFVPAALLLGLVLRRPLIKLTAFFERRLKDSKLM